MPRAGSLASPHPLGAGLHWAWALARARAYPLSVTARAAIAGRPRQAAPGQVAFRCNLCGAHCSAPLDAVRSRETPSCRVCRSNLRFRALIAALQSRLLGEISPLRLLPVQKQIAGLGMSDASVYAAWLQRKFDYTNTFFHTRPFLDIQHPDPAQRGRYDFVITSDVMEHVQPPVANAFGNLRALLRRSGILAMTVPYGTTGATREHFPELHDFHIEGIGAQRRLVNVTRDGRLQEFTDLHFHGGDGATLEMRVFSLPDLRQSLTDAGFRDIRVHDQALPEWGILPAGPCSLPITAVAG